MRLFIIAMFPFVVVGKTILATLLTVKEIPGLWWHFWRSET